MRIERAIEILNPEHREHYESIEPVNEACRMGMKALEKQILKKPIYSGGHEYICPNCNRFTRKRVQQHGNIIIPYCKWCGQAFGWRETE